MLHYVHDIKKPCCLDGSLYFENSWWPGRDTGISDRICESIDVTSVKICSQIGKWVLICLFRISRNSDTSWLFTIRLLYWASVSYLWYIMWRLYTSYMQTIWNYQFIPNLMLYAHSKDCDCDFTHYCGYLCIYKG